MVRKFFNRNPRTVSQPDEPLPQRTDLGSLAQNLQQILHQQVAQPNRLQIRCAVRDGVLLILVEHLLHVEPDPQKTFTVLEELTANLVPGFMESDPACSPTAYARPLPARIYLRVAAYQQPYAFHSFTLEPRSPLANQGIAPLDVNSVQSYHSLLVEPDGLSAEPSTPEVASLEEATSEVRSHSPNPEVLSLEEPAPRTLEPEASEPEISEPFEPEAENVASGVAIEPEPIPPVQSELGAVEEVEEGIGQEEIEQTVEETTEETIETNEELIPEAIESTLEEEEQVKPAVLEAIEIEEPIVETAPEPIESVEKLSLAAIEPEFEADYSEPAFQPELPEPELPEPELPTVNLEIVPEPIEVAEEPTKANSAIEPTVEETNLEQIPEATEQPIDVTESVGGEQDELFGLIEGDELKQDEPFNQSENLLNQSIEPSALGSEPQLTDFELTEFSPPELPPFTQPDEQANFTPTIGFDPVADILNSAPGLPLTDSLIPALELETEDTVDSLQPVESEECEQDKVPFDEPLEQAFQSSEPSDSVAEGSTGSDEPSEPEIQLIEQTHLITEELSEVAELDQENEHLEEQEVDVENSITEAGLIDSPVSNLDQTRKSSLDTLDEKKPDEPEDEPESKLISADRWEDAENHAEPPPSVLLIPSANDRSPSSFDLLPTDVDHKTKAPWRSKVTLFGVLTTGAVSLFAIVGVVYALSRPCVLGNTCQPIQEARQLSERALETIQSNPSALEVVDAYDQLTQASQLLEPIPLWSRHRAEARTLLAGYNAESDELGVLVSALNQANNATKKSLNPPHPVQTWREVQWTWRETIELLEQVPETSPVYALAQGKQDEYQANLESINHRIRIEQETQDRIAAVRQAAEVIEARSRVVNSSDSWQQTYDSWQTLIAQLQQIPQGTMAYGEAQRLIQLYQLKINESERRRDREQLSAESYGRAMNFAEQARQFEQGNQWTQAANQWREAVTQIRQVQEDTSNYSQAQALIDSYTDSFNRAEENARRMSLMQTATPQLDRACNGNPRLCSYTLEGNAIRVQMASSYDLALQRAFASAQQSGSNTVQTDLSPQLNQFLRTLAVAGETAQVPIELYNAAGSKFGAYDPNRGGYLLQ
ncbi:hypothetical protein C7B76_18125 [filamentous cyanobacterium CCP2]|nr:hypothetical protein C7B76_18125 [filamentous cyanobacterium CCP2]